MWLAPLNSWTTEFLNSLWLCYCSCCAACRSYAALKDLIHAKCDPPGQPLISPQVNRAGEQLMGFTAAQQQHNN